MTIRAVLFDMDGVLIDAREWHYESLNRALALFGHKIARHEHLESYDGLPTRSKLRMLSLERRFPVSLHDFVNQLKQVYTTEMIAQHCRPNFAHQFALARLRREGYRVAICSNSIRATMELMLGKACLLEYTEFFLSNEDIKHPKPHPEIYLTAMERLGVAPHECLIVEDNVNGIKAATASGGHVMKVVDVNDVSWMSLRRAIQSFANAPGGTVLDVSAPAAGGA
jgi:beta-phosphoglucomutase